MNSRIPAAAVLCGILLTTAACSSSTPEGGSEGASTESAQSEQTPLGPIEIEDGKMPDVVGHDLHESIVALRQMGLLYEMEGEGFDAEDEATSTREWVVVEQTPASGEDVERRDTVTLTVERRQ